MKFLSGGPGTLTVTADGTYQTVDLTAHIPAADQGDLAIAMISTINAAASQEDAAVRAVGSTDDPTDGHRQNGGRLFWYPKVSASDQIEIKLAAAGTWAVRFWGYFLTSEAVGFINPSANDFTPGIVDTWTDADISTLTGVDTALAAIVHIVGPGGGPIGSAGLRVNGSTDTLRPDQIAANRTTHIIGVDGSEIFEANVGNTSYLVKVAGYIKANLTALTNMVDVSGASSGVYEDIDLSGSIPANNTFMVGLVDHTGSSDRTSGLRQNGWTVDEQGKCRQQQGFAMGIDGSRIMEHNRSTAAIELYLRGYGTEPDGGGGGGLPIPVARHHYRQMMGA